MARWDPALIDLIRQRTDIVEVISEYVSLMRAGSNYKGLSPFKKEKTPSFYVTPSKQLWYCFSTGQGGDVFTFLQNYLGLDFPSAVRMLAQRAGIELPEAFSFQDTSVSEKREKSLKEQLYLLHERLTSHWHRTLLQSDLAQEARDYLASRGVGMETIQEFRLGYAPPGWENISIWAKEEGYDEQLLITAGLLVCKEDSRGKKLYDRFRNRIMIPITSESGHIVAFSGRTLEKDNPREAKYINSPETPIFQKSRILFGLEMHRRALLEARQAIVVEGPFDLIACHRAGIKNVVASQGTALTEHQVCILRRYVDEVVLCYDSDEAGQQAMIRAATVCYSHGLPVRVLQICSEKAVKEDPDSLIRKHGAEGFLSLANCAQDFWGFYFQFLSHKHPVTTERGRMVFQNEIFRMINHLSDPTEIDRILQRLSAYLGTDVRLLQSKLIEFQMKNRSNTSDTNANQQQASQNSQHSIHPVVAELLYLCLTDPNNNIPTLQKDLPREWLESLDGQSLLQDLLDTYGTDQWEGTFNYINSQDANLRQTFYKIYLSQPQPPPLRQILEHLEKKYLQRKLLSLEYQLANANTENAEKNTDILIQILDIKKKLHTFSTSAE